MQKHIAAITINKSEISMLKEMKNSIKQLLVACVIAMGVSTPVMADQSIDELSKTLTKSMPGLTIDSLRPTPVNGLYELVSGSEVAYVTSDGNHMIQGMLFNVPERKNLTEQTLSASRAQSLKTIDPSSLLVFPAKGAAKHTITVFTDPSCPFCVRLHGELQKLNELGITVRYALYARNGNGTLTGRQLSEVLCSADQKAELDKFFRAPSREAKGADCKKAAGLERIAKVAQQVGLKGTPHIVTDNGLALSGYQPAEELLKALQGS